MRRYHSCELQLAVCVYNQQEASKYVDSRQHLKGSCTEEEQKKSGECEKVSHQKKGSQIREMTCVGFFFIFVSQAAKGNLRACKCARTVISLRSIVKGFIQLILSLSPLFFSVHQGAGTHQRLLHFSDATVFSLNTTS